MNSDLILAHLQQTLEEIEIKYSIEDKDEDSYVLIKFRNSKLDYNFEINILVLDSVQALSFIVTDMLKFELDISKEQLLNEINNQNSSLLFGKITFSEGSQYIYGIYEYTLNLERDNELISAKELKSTISYIVSYKRQLETAKRIPIHS
ncbi:hypothetical protein ABE61_00180 [Lysinibacillus sphaericus]|uniref:hypothetical protein n=1 Tax=Lysinibacillus sphaericus TaxID=1421 RepID=UPI0018CF6D20|nr:hypothetical protein [Lysinibacillus sphaericus]MBG9452546.1 hypothetical protein [Lysinibacillus sphaericus]MBG9477291.1 hypothetical protein [Lysinibacillus sphaericus]MBG9592797.1 hypothetical protein [Lysinibacillus sphaericus]